jgi:hypothetical protein
MSTKMLGLAALLTIVACGTESDDDTTTDPTDASMTAQTMTSAMTSPTSDDDDATSADPTTDPTDATTSGDDHGSSGHDDATTTDHGTDDHGTDDHGADDHGTGTTAGSLCDILGEGCHDNMTPEGIDCHLIGHDGDEAACAEIYDACVEICGL